MAAVTHKPDEPIETKPRDRGLSTELKRRLIDHMEMLKRPNDIVRVTQITNHHFRVNTLSRFHPEDRVMETFRITKSQFLSVEDRLGELVIDDQTRKH